VDLVWIGRFEDAGERLFGLFLGKKICNHSVSLRLAEQKEKGKGKLTGKTSFFEEKCRGNGCAVKCSSRWLTR
jgi:hypothetical protein